MATRTFPSISPATQRPHVGLNLMWLVPGVVGGSEDAAVGLLGGLVPHLGLDLELTVYAQPTFVAAYPVLTAQLECVTFQPPSASKAARVVAESTWLSWRARRDHLDVMHYFGGVIPPGAPKPSILTVHDVQPLEFAENFSSVKARWLATMIPRSVAVAELVSVPSSFVRERLIALVDVDPDKVVVQPHGAPGVRPAPDLADVDAIRHRYRLAGRFLLYPAITYAHKNHRMLIEAFARFHSDHPDVVLVLTGGQGPVEPGVVEAIEHHGVGDAVRRTGRIPRRDLDILFKEADGLVFPSRYEGLGLPVFEAMTDNCPVIASNVTALPEVVGGDGRLVDPDSVDGWADAMAALFDDEAETRRMVDSARTRMTLMTWPKVVSSTIRNYHQIADIPDGEKP